MRGGLPGDDEDDLLEPTRLRQLRWLVNALTVTLILGFLVVVATLVIRLSAAPAPLALPAALTLPEGETARAVTMGSDWIAVVTVDGDGRERIRVLDRATGASRLEAPILPSPGGG
jgi:hypothetical protein